MPVSVYGNVISLLSDGGGKSGLHLDIGCGYGAIAEPIRDEIGLNYIGFDTASDGLSALAERGFETHSLDLLDIESAERTIRFIVGERHIASITIIDVLEHLTNGSAVIAMLRRLVVSEDTKIVVSVPNISHKDIALKLLIGRWDITEAGLLDHTHVDFYNDRRLTDLMRRQGWRETSRRDWLLEVSDQHFPSGSPVFNRNAPIARFLRRTLDGANTHAIVNQFVRIFTPVEPQASSPYASPSEGVALFLSVIVDVGQSTEEQVIATLQSLKAQADKDFEVFLVDLVKNDRKRNFMSSIQEKIGIQKYSITECTGNCLITAINAALTQFSGSYISIISGGDEVGPVWVSAFRGMAVNAPGAVLATGQSSNEENFRENFHLDEISLLFSNPSILASESVGDYAIPRNTLKTFNISLNADLKEFAVFALVVDASILTGLCVSSEITVTKKSSKYNVDEESANQSFLAWIQHLNAQPLLLSSGSLERLVRASRELKWFVGMHHELTKRLQQSGEANDLLTGTLNETQARLGEKERELVDTVGELTRKIQQNDETNDLLTRTLNEMQARLGEKERELVDTVGELTKKIQQDDETNDLLTRTLNEAKIRFTEKEKTLTDTLGEIEPIANFLGQHRQVRDLMNLYQPWLRHDLEEEMPKYDPGRPFLTVITRTQGTRLRTLRDVLITMAGQTCQLFEHLIVVHSDDDRKVRAIEELVAEYPESQRSKIVVLQCQGQGRSAPINDAWKIARGEYVSVLDDDDLVFSHWVETFRILACEKPGSVLRAVCTRQDFERSSHSDVGAQPRATSWFKNDWPSTYDPVRHLWENLTPFMSVSFPRNAVNASKLYFDEKLTTVEDWDFTTRLIMLCGIHTSPEITSIYRWWTNAESSSFLYERDEWKSNHDYVLNKIASQPILLPAGSSKIIADLYKDRDIARWESDKKIIEAEKANQEIYNLNKKLNDFKERARILEQYLERVISTSALNNRRARSIEQEINEDSFDSENESMLAFHRLKIDVLESGLFDPDWYLDRNHDVKANDLDPLEHFVEYGIYEQRDPGPMFDSSLYLSMHTDVAAIGMSPFLHYLSYGRAEGRNYGILR